MKSITLLPPPSACASFRPIIEIYNYTYLQGIPALTTPCTSSLNLNVAPTDGTTYSSTSQRSLTDKLSAVSVFTLTTTYQLNLRFAQFDAVGGITMKLQNSNTSKIYQPFYTANHIYMNQYLPAGTYTLTFSNTTTTKNFACTPYALSYNLSMSTKPDDVCGDDYLPSDLFSDEGGSDAYGGPQAADGSIHLVGKDLLMLSDKMYADNYITFNVYSKSLIGVFVDIDDGSTITVSLYSAPFKTGSIAIQSLVVSKKSGGNKAKWTVDAAANASYVLNVQFTSVNRGSACNYFDFEFVLEPQSTAIESLACPSPLPGSSLQLPPSAITLYANKDFSTSSDQYIVTSDKFKRIMKYNYYISIVAKADVTIFAEVGYDFLINDFSMTLQRGRFFLGSPVATGKPMLADDTDMGFNFRNVIQYKAQAGTYTLTLVDTIVNNLNLTTYCHPFSFSLYAIAENITNPRVILVQPSLGNNLDPNEPFTLVVTFSELAKVALPANYSLTPYLAQNGVVYLQGSRTGATVSPTLAYFDDSNTQLIMRFPKSFKDSSYKLVFDTSKFSTSSGVAFAQGVLADLGNFTMATKGCSDCNNHGTCDKGVCTCTAGWTGVNCDRCADGFHPSGSDCVANLKCAVSSCNGHGNCSDATGEIECDCLDGYAGPFCDSCDTGYIGYPNCTKDEDDDVDSEGTCTASLLPSSFDSPAYLGTNGQMHIQDYFYIAPDLKTHEIKFSLAVLSIFRIYVEPHVVDIDAWLFMYTQDGGTTVVGSELGFGTEETIFVQLQPGKYLLRFRYFFWVPMPSNCEVFNLELAISPADVVVAEVSNTQVYCSSQSNLGALPANISVSDAYSFRGSGFTVNSKYTKIDKEANFFYGINITINPPADHIASLHATVGFRFLQGAVSLQLESGTKYSHCYSSQLLLQPPPGCVYGDNLGNENTLHQYLEAGQYTLWIYEPIKQLPNISTCAPFDFSFHIDFVDAKEDIFNCDLELVPSDLDNVEYMEIPGKVHFHDVFLLDNRNMSFDVTKRSMLRVAVSGSDPTVKLYSSGQIVVTNGDDQNILIIVNPGRYQLVFGGDYFSFCPTLDIEFALEPIGNSASQACPPRTNGDPPNIQLPTTFLRSNYSYQPFYTFNSVSNTIVAKFPFTLTSNGWFLDANVESDFLTGDLRLELYNMRDAGSRPITTSNHLYSYNLLQKDLSKGQYELRIVLPPGDRVSNMPGCIPYFFEVSLDQRTPCYGEHLPTTLSSMHFLGQDQQMHYFSKNWLLPTYKSFMTLQTINLTVSQISMIRVYTEPHSVDIDIKILNANKSVVASGSNRINGEEDMNYVLEANAQYYFQLQIFAFGGAVKYPKCATFPMEIAIAPIPTRAPLCPDFVSLWPNIPASINLPYYYDSIDEGDKLYIQQTLNNRVYYNRTLNIASKESKININIVIGYDFLVGELELSLYSPITKQTYFSTNDLNRNSLVLEGIPKDKYEMRLYEASIPNSASVACSEYTFSLFIESYTSFLYDEGLLIKYHFPRTLDSIPYLNASSSVHLANDYFMFDGSGMYQNTTFTIKEASILRVHTQFADAESLSGQSDAPLVTLYKSGVVQSTQRGFLLSTLQPGSYMVKLTPPASFTEDDLGARVSVELAIDTVAHVRKDIAATSYPPTTCISTPFPSDMEVSPSGYYQDGNTDARVTSSALLSGAQVAAFSFDLDRYSLVYAQVGFDFLISELELRLYDDNKTTQLYGRMRRNINEIHEVLAPGSYNLIIKQPQNQTLAQIPAHCGLFSYSVIIKDLANTGATIDCAVLNQIPWQLDSATGGSSPYGGPIKDGYLHFYGEDMHIPLHSVSPLNFTVSELSILSILVVDLPSNIAVTYTMTSASGVAITPSAVLPSASARFRLVRYLLDAASYTLGINYRGLYVRGSCSAYTLQIDLVPAQDYIDELECSAPPKSELPAIITPDPNTGSASGSVSSFFPILTTSGMQRPIIFNVTNATNVIFTFAFNSLVSMYSMNLTRINTKNPSSLAVGVPKAQEIQSGGLNTYLYISMRIAAGSYALYISHPVIDLPNSMLGMTSACPPYSFTYQIGNPQSTISIVDVDPPGSRFFSTESTFVITVTFSATPYNASGSPVRPQDAGLFLTAFALQSADQSKSIAPFLVRPLIGRPVWAMHWKALITADETYTLILKSGVLFDSAQHDIVLPDLYQYTTAKCGEHGVFSTSQQKCTCYVGYAGALCDTCDIVHNYVKAQDNAAVCVTNQCVPNSCGCTDPPKCASKIGSCAMYASGDLGCACPPAYSGKKCEKCAAGYSNYPICFKSASITTSTSSTGNPNNKSSKSGLSSGAIAGIVIGVIVFIGAAAGAGGFIWYRKRQEGNGRYKLLSHLDHEETSFQIEDDSEL